MTTNRRISLNAIVSLLLSAIMNTQRSHYKDFGTKFYMRNISDNTIARRFLMKTTISEIRIRTSEKEASSPNRTNIVGLVRQFRFFC